MQKPAIVIAPDGHFLIPLAGQITAAGKTVSEIRQEIETKLAKVHADPVVTVGITEVAGNVSYVIGQVTKPGSFVMNPRINVLQALSWPAVNSIRQAQRHHCHSWRTDGGQQKVIPFNFGQVSSGKNVDQKHHVGERRCRIGAVITRRTSRDWRCWRHRHGRRAAILWQPMIQVGAEGDTNRDLITSGDTVPADIRQKRDAPDITSTPNALFVFQRDVGHSGQAGSHLFRLSIIGHQ